MCFLVLFTAGYWAFESSYFEMQRKKLKLSMIHPYKDASRVLIVLFVSFESWFAFLKLQFLFPSTLSSSFQLTFQLFFFNYLLIIVKTWSVLLIAIFSGNLHEKSIVIEKRIAKFLILLDCSFFLYLIFA